MHKYLVSCFVIVLFLGGCGFELRGTISPLPSRFAKTYFEHAALIDDELRLKVEQLLLVSGAELVTRQEADVSIRLSDVEKYSRQIALSGNGSVKEYERTFTTVVTVIDLKTGIQLGSRRISTVRNIQLDDRRVLAGEEQSEMTKTNAEQTLAQSVIAYLKTF